VSLSAMKLLMLICEIQNDTTKITNPLHFQKGRVRGQGAGEFGVHVSFSEVLAWSIPFNKDAHKLFTEIRISKAICLFLVFKIKVSCHKILGNKEQTRG